ncbi:MAG TPA: ankyrin repeat domain-containing protein [Gammaproteobacteria bacterium]|nr:ankyrin repeat domain-containing protein [Gammaproteobacteria bacterium]
MHPLESKLLNTVVSNSIPPKEKLAQVKVILQWIQRAKEAKEISINCPFLGGKTLLMLAAIYPDHENILKALACAKADLNLQSKSKKTALMYAVTADYEKNVDALIQVGADLDIQGGADLDTQRELKQTALVCAVSMEKPNVYIVKLLVRAGAGLEIPDHEGKTALDIAIEQKNLEVVSVLLRYDAKVRNMPALHAFLDSQIRPEQVDRVQLCRGICYRQAGDMERAKEIHMSLLYPCKPDGSSDYSRNLVIEHTAYDRVLRAYLLGESFRDPEDREAWMRRAEREVWLSQFLDQAYALSEPLKVAAKASLPSLFSQPGSAALFPPPVENNESKPDASNLPDHQVVVDKNQPVQGKI